MCYTLRLGGVEYKERNNALIHSTSVLSNKAHTFAFLLFILSGVCTWLCRFAARVGVNASSIDLNL